MKQNITGKKYAPLGLTLLAYASLAGWRLIDLLRQDWRGTAHSVAEVAMGLTFFVLLITLCSGLTLIL